MSNNDDDTKISRVDHTKRVKNVESVENIGATEATKSVKRVSKTAGVGKLREVGKIVDGSRVVTSKEREMMLNIVSEEAKSMLANSGLSKKKQQIITDAVAYAIESGMIVDEDLKEAFAEQIKGADGKKGKK